MSKAEYVGMLVISILFSYLFWGHTFGVSMLIFTAVVVAIVLRGKMKTMNTKNPLFILHLGLLAYLSACVMFYRNEIILFITIPVILLLLLALIFVGKEGYTFLNNFQLLFMLLPERVINALNEISSVTKRMKEVFANKTEKEKGAGSKVLKGVLISIPLIIVFTLLFSSADPVFKEYVEKIIKIDWNFDLVFRIIVIIVMFYFLAAYLWYSNSKTTCTVSAGALTPKRELDEIMTFTVLILLNILFLAFIFFQLKYLFGGDSVIRNTSITYADYAHKGFLEFWITVVLVSVIVVVSRYKLIEEKYKGLVGWAQVALLLQTIVIIASAGKRILVYEEAYGYTYLRILVGLFLIWMAVVFVLFIIAVLKKKDLGWLASQSLFTAGIFLVFVSTVSFDKYIAKANVDRHLINNKEIDTSYLRGLSTDIYPEILKLSEYSTDPEVKLQAEKLLERLRTSSDMSKSFWGSYNVSSYKAGK